MLGIAYVRYGYGISRKAKIQYALKTYRSEKLSKAIFHTARKVFMGKARSAGGKLSYYINFKIGSMICFPLQRASMSLETQRYCCF